MGGCAAGGIGLGGGTIYNPTLLALGQNPKVSSATAMYLVMFTTFNVCVINMINQTLNWRYGLFLGGCNVVGSVIGLFFSDRYVQKTGRQSFFIFVLAIIFILSVIVTPFVAYVDLRKMVEDGINIF